MGHLLLAGGAEFGGRMSEPDLRAIELTGGFVTSKCLAKEYLKTARSIIGGTGCFY